VTESLSLHGSVRNDRFVDGQAPAPAHPITVAGRYFHAGDEKFTLRGVTYGTFGPGPDGEAFPPDLTLSRDFRAMRAAGFNSVRTYTVPSARVLDAAARHGLRVLVGIPWTQHVSFLDDRRLMEGITSRVRAGVRSCAGHPALLGFAIGNEIPAEIVRWSGRRRTRSFLRRLYEAAKDVSSEALITYANFPPTEYLDLPFLDFVSFNVYLESKPRFEAYLARLHHLAGDRPLVMSELGLDSRRHGPMEQARHLRDQVMTAERRGCAGSFVFAWTDEWHRGGRDVADWDFGLTARDRSSKPALAALRTAFARAPRAPDGEWPRMSIVVCAYNAAETLDRCLARATRVDYPDFEVIVVDDGSTDDTAAIAAYYDVQLIRTENRGLSAARNTGIEAASGEIVAFLDADAWPDPDWLSHLARTFAWEDVHGVGGPNVPPPGGGRVESCVANAPGGPVHVMLTDRVAEHIPGCNMAFRASALEAIGGLDPRFRTAGDDVDLCWRIQERGWKIGFAPGAMVWHHPRRTIAGYWRQQCGYGAAEALLEAKWPEKYNALGHVSWGGRVYGTRMLLPFRPGRIYGGTWGQEAYQRLEPSSPWLVWDAAAMPEWYLILLLLAVLTGVGLLWSPLLFALPLLLAGVAVVVARAAAGGARAIFRTATPSPSEIRRRRMLTAFLHLIQPLARLQGRFMRGLVPWRLRADAAQVVWPARRELTLWSDEGHTMPEVLSELERGVATAGVVIRRGGEYDLWDLRVEGGALGAARLRSCVEWHGEGRQLFRFSVSALPSLAAWTATLVPLVMGLWAVLDGAPGVAALLTGLSVLAAVRALLECGASTGVLVDGVRGLGAVLERSRMRVVEPEPIRPLDVRAVG
jgi:GT2 family glycosyltransferase